MYKWNIFLMALFFTISQSSCGDKIESHWKTHQIKIDGDGSDWEGYPLQYNEDMKIVYGIVNDDHNLEFMIRFNDKRLAHQFAVRGFTLWVNDEAEQGKNLGIFYLDETMRVRAIENIKSRSRGSESSLNTQQNMEPTGEFFLAKNKTDSDQKISDVPGFSAAAAYANDLYCYEFSFPLTKNVSDMEYLDISENMSISVGLEIAGMTAEEKEKMKEQLTTRREGGRSGGGMAGGMRGGMGVGGKNGGGRRSGGQLPQLPDIDGEEYWVTVQLAAK
jgi:hypothetical protein